MTTLNSLRNIAVLGLLGIVALAACGEKVCAGGVGGGGFFSSGTYQCVEGTTTSQSDARTTDDSGGINFNGGPDARTQADGAAGLCKSASESCDVASDCCSNNCNLSTRTCIGSIGACHIAGDACTSGLECCTRSCVGKKCSAAQCTSDGATCASGAECCSGACGTDNKCAALNTSCKTSGNACTTHANCCSGLCSGGTCQGQPSFCTQLGDACVGDTECCTGSCSKTTGASIGTCGPTTSPGATGCTVAGSVCGAGASASADAGVPSCGGDCCSRSCRIYEPTGVAICQPPSGCRPTGELCANDNDCCGAPGVAGGNGSVHCSKGSASDRYGRCDNGNACRAAGSICKLAGSSCNAENNCCSGNVNSTPLACQQDILGIPRCTVAAVACVQGVSKAGAACGSSADCCGLTCTPNADGATGYSCTAACMPSGETCTTTADCCAGVACVVTAGSTRGTCGGGSTGSDAGPTTPPNECAYDGQQCGSNGACCSELCNSTTGRCDPVLVQ